MKAIWTILCSPTILKFDIVLNKTLLLLLPRGVKADQAPSLQYAFDQNDYFCIYYYC